MNQNLKRTQILIPLILSAAALISQPANANILIHNAYRICQLQHVPKGTRAFTECMQYQYRIQLIKVNRAKIYCSGTGPQLKFEQTCQSRYPHPNTKGFIKQDACERKQNLKCILKVLKFENR